MIQIILNMFKTNLFKTILFKLVCFKYEHLKHNFYSQHSVRLYKLIGFQSLKIQSFFKILLSYLLLDRLKILYCTYKKMRQAIDTMYIELFDELLDRCQLFE